MFAGTYGSDILNEMLFTVAVGEPQVPRHDVSLDGVSQPTGVRDSGNDILRLLERNFDALLPQLLVSQESLLHCVGLALLDPSGEAAGEENGVFEDDAGRFTLGRHSVLLNFCQSCL